MENKEQVVILPVAIPVICRRCDGVYQPTTQAHDDCCETKAAPALSAHDANELAFIASLQAQVKAAAGVAA